MSMPTGPLQFHYKEQRFWGIETRHYVVLDTWLEYNRLPYFQFYTSFINWCIKLATNYNKTGGKKLKPREADVRAALHGEHFRNPFQLIRILETFRATVYRGQPMKGWIKDHTDEKQLLGGIKQLWNLLYSRKEGGRGTLRAAKKHKKVEKVENEEREEEDGEEEDEDEDEGEGNGRVTVDDEGDPIRPEPMSP